MLNSILSETKLDSQKVPQLNRQTFDRQWLEESRPFLMKAFDAFKPRSSYLSKSKKIERVNVLQLDEDEQPNIVMKDFDLATTQSDDIPSFDEAFSGCPQFKAINEKFLYLQEYVRPHIESCKTHFITFSTNMTGAKLGVQHLHPLMNGDRCNVWSFCVPLYIADSPQRHQFCYNHQKELFSPRYYIDYQHLKKLNIKYSSFGMPIDGKVFSLQFDGARTPHYIDYTDHLYAWLVFDGVQYKAGAEPADAFVARLHD